jgi:hypothetical protein
MEAFWKPIKNIKRHGESTNVRRDLAGDAPAQKPPVFSCTVL